MNITTNTQTKQQNELLRKSFSIAALAFLAICLIGYIASIIVDSTGVLKKALGSVSRFDFKMYAGQTSEEIRRLSYLSFGAIGLIFLSSILNMVWMFRALRASKGFIYTVYIIYVIAQGLGFGMLFVTWKATQLLAVFGIAGGIFAVVATLGYFAKDLWPLGKLLFYGSFVAMGLGLVFFIMGLTGVYNDTIAMLFWTFTGVLTIGWIAFDVWWIKRSNVVIQMYNQFDKDMKFRIIAISSFKLLSDLVTLIWIVLRFASRFMRN